MDWLLTCRACGTTAPPDGLPTVCTTCGQPWLVTYPDRIRPGLMQRAELRRGFSMWRFRPFLPITEGETPVSLGEGDTPLLPLARWGEQIGLPRLLVPGLRDIRGYRAMYRDFHRAITGGGRAGVSLERAIEDQHLMDQEYATLGSDSHASA